MKKNKKKKLLYALLTFVLLLVCVGGYTLYIFKFKEYDVADPEVDKIKEEHFTITLPDGTELELDGEGNVIGEKSKPTASAAQGPSGVGSSDVENSNNAQGTNSDSTTGSTAPPTNTNEKLTVADIKNQYKPTLAALEQQINGKLNGLIGQAKNEYSTKKANGENISYSYFYQKYVGAAESLEASTDAVFESVMGMIEQDLEENGYSGSYADSFREEYNATKESLRSSLLDKAMSGM